MNESMQTYQTNDRPEKEKIFTLQRAEDETTIQIIGARRSAICDPDLNDGAKVLFCLLLDMAVSRASSYGFGAVLISVTKLTEALNRCPRAIFAWKKQLIAKRYIWITKVPMPNFWPVDVYHIAALTQPGEMNQMATKDGYWGNGARRQLPDKIGKGAREPGQKALGLRGIKGHRKDFDTDSSNLPENATESGTKGHSSEANYATGSGTKVQRGAARNDTGEPHESAAGSRTKVQRGAARNDTSEPHKGAHIRSPKLTVKRVSESGEASSPPQSSADQAFSDWEKSLSGSFPSRLEKMRERFKEQRKRATVEGKALLNRKLQKLDALLDGPQPEWAEPKKSAARLDTTVSKIARRELTDAELLEAAQAAVSLGKEHLLNDRQRELLKGAKP